jgi:predicted small lipoprotein YifL
MHRSVSDPSVVAGLLRAVALPVLVALGGCGQKGPLFLGGPAGGASAPVAAAPLPPPPPVRP